jgi:hypothetical protein
VRTTIVVLIVVFCGCEEAEEAYAGLLSRQPGEAVHARRLKVLATSSAPAVCAALPHHLRRSIVNPMNLF